MIEQIFLIGYRATGKTTIGKPLANRLGFDFLDTDHLIRHRMSCDVADIVAAEGWEGFRRYEAEALAEAGNGRKMVIATGGGAILHQGFWQRISDKGFIVWLSADLLTLTKRLKLSEDEDRGRPSLTGKTIHAEVKTVLEERLPLYRQYADIEVDTGKMGTTEAVDVIVAEYQRRCCGSKS